jgi:hypothetical protein
MNRYPLVLLFLLLVSAAAYGQQLVPEDESKNPCAARFKMRVLVPSDIAMRSETKPIDLLDRWMVNRNLSRRQ